MTRGNIIADNLSFTFTDSIHVNMFWMVDKNYQLGIPITFKCVTHEIKGRIAKIHKKFDPVLVEVVESNATTIKPAEAAEVDIELEAQATG